MLFGKDPSSETLTKLGLQQDADTDCPTHYVILRETRTNVADMIVVTTSTIYRDPETQRSN